MMPHDNPDATDPLALHGVAVETCDDRAMHEMAECFVEEYVRSGFDPKRIMHMFKAQQYAGPYLVCQALGEDAIRKMIDEQMRLRNLHRSKRRNEQSTGREPGDASRRGCFVHGLAPEALNGGISLPVLDS